ncbi:MFS transporter [uncultured Tissierella sp.]|jgi:maltose/moltooligosaccharide transporter|uniref:MFS transporter n=1 Tax=uncultured Tissierella sp. TaxID=448160 RepID=UPI002805580D|nr:MFS transporter [uncultured Tissierella sp.]MDU5080065.1 MFS transporter [Bacillota bacterium]
MKLNYKRTFFVGLAFLSISAFWQLYDNIIPLILQNTFKVGETMTGTIMAVDNILALFLLPIFGALSDRIRTRFGRRTPFIVIGTVIAVISMMMIPIADNNQNFILFFISLGVVLLSMSIYRSPAVALMPDITPKPLRSKANSIINLMGAVGAIFTLAMISILIPKESSPNYTNIFLSVAILMVVAVGILVITIRENKLAKEVSSTDCTEDEESNLDNLNESITMDKNVRRSLNFIFASIFLWFTAYNAVTTAFSRYAITVWDLQGGGFANALMVATGAAILSYIPIGIISSNIGRKKTIIGGIVIMSISYFFGFWFKTYSPLINVVFAFTGIGWAAINVNSYPMVVEMARSADVGKYTGLYYIFSMSAQVFTPILSGFLLENISYRTLFPYSFVFSLLSLGTMLMVRHGDSKPPKRKSTLEHFDVED